MFRRIRLTNQSIGSPERIPMMTIEERLERRQISVNEASHEFLVRWFIVRVRGSGVRGSGLERAPNATRCIRSLLHRPIRLKRHHPRVVPHDGTSGRFGD